MSRNRLTAYILFLCFLAAPAYLPASTAEEIETLLGTGAVTYAQAARFVLEAADVIIIGGLQEAFDYAAQQGWLPAGAAPGDPARLDGISLLLMRAFNIRGGIFYSLIKSPHYAHHELAYMGVLQGRTDPSMTVSGERLLFYTSRILSSYETQDAGGMGRLEEAPEAGAADMGEDMAAETAIPEG